MMGGVGFRLVVRRAVGGALLRVAVGGVDWFPKVNTERGWGLGDSGPTG